MGAEPSKKLDKKASRTKSNLSQKSVNNQISQFASQLNSYTSLQSSTANTFNFVAFDNLPFNGNFSPLPICNRVSKQNKQVFICYDCSKDEHAYLCEPCFEKGNHDGHRFSVFGNNAGWNTLFCRCGDSDFMKDDTVCEHHKQAQRIRVPKIDPKQRQLFFSYMNEIFKSAFSLIEKNRGYNLMTSLFRYLEKITVDNVYYSKMLCEFFLDSDPIQHEKTTLRKLLVQFDCQGITNIMRNLSFIVEYKQEILRQIIGAICDVPDKVSQYCELLLNFAGKVDVLEKLAKDDGLVLVQNQRGLSFFYGQVVNKTFNSSQIWKAVIRNNLIKHIAPKNGNIMDAIIKQMNKQRDLKDIESLLCQLLQLDANKKIIQKYITACLMMLKPQIFTYKKGAKVSFNKQIEEKFQKYYKRRFQYLSTYTKGEFIGTQLLLILPFFSFGQKMLNIFWKQISQRMNTVSLNKLNEQRIQAYNNYFTFFTQMIKNYLQWQHRTVRLASQFDFREFIKDKKLIEKLLLQYFDTNPKIMKADLLLTIDAYTNGQREMTKDIVKKYLRFNIKKGKYYFIGKKIPNNLFDIDCLCLQAPLKLSDWHQFISKKVFVDEFYDVFPKLVKVAQKGVVKDLNMIKQVSNISAFLILHNPSSKKLIKLVTRNFIKQIPDVKESTYYALANIRDRLQLDIDEIEQNGAKGRKKVKPDLINEIRNKKFQQIKAKQQKMRNKWLKLAQQQQQAESSLNQQVEICHVCKQKADQTNRFVYPCNFTRNSVISTLLKSQVTDLDMNICLHHVHEKCFNQLNKKRQCPVCKFQINCYIPVGDLRTQSYTKPWLVTFQNIVTRINIESGKAFSSDWSTIFLMYLVFSRGFKVLLDNSELRERQRAKIDELLMFHFHNNLEKFPDLTKNALKKAEKTVKGQVTRESHIKKVVKSLTFDLTLQQITQQPFKNQKRVLKKIRQLINTVGQEKGRKIIQSFVWCQGKQSVEELFDSMQQMQQQENEHENMFKLKELPQTAEQFLKEFSIKCPMCGKYQSSTWQCLFCDKVSCGSCMNTRFHCERDHRGNGIILYLNDADYEFFQQNRNAGSGGLYKNEYQEVWRRNQSPQGWKADTEEIHNFFQLLLHSDTNKKNDDTSDPWEMDDQASNNDNVNRIGYDDDEEEQQEEQEEEDSQEDCMEEGDE